MTGMTTTRVRRRIVLLAPGFEPLAPAAQRDRFARTLARTADLWSLRAEVGALGAEPDSSPAFRARAAGPDWHCEAEIRLLAWDDLIAAELARGWPALLRRGGGALAAVLLEGTLARYAAAHWRYALFALSPLLPLAGLAAALLLAALAVQNGEARLALPAIAVAGLAAWGARRLKLGLLLADWAFARDLALGTDPPQSARIGQFAGAILATRGAAADEVVLAGHSLGAVLLVQALAEALRRDPRLLDHAPRLVLVGLGSSVLKVALQPGAARLRADLALLAGAPGFEWVDLASRRDALSFERSEPVRTLGLPGRGPRRESIHPRDMLDAATWARVRWNFLRLHRQYVMGNGRRYFWDFGLMACGPLPVGGALRPDRALGPDGALGRAPPVEPVPA
jgi:hypothetical protein